MSGLRAAKKRETRKAILKAAIGLFSEKGYERTSVEDLARAAGVGKGTIYGYFRTKDEIFLAFCEEELDYAFSVLAQQVEPDAPVEERLLTLFMSQFRFVTENREFGRHVIREMAFPQPLSSEKSRSLDARYLKAVGEILECAKHKGELHPELDPFLGTVHFYALYLVALSGWYTGYVHTLPEVEEKLRILFLQALEGIRPGNNENREAITAENAEKAPPLVNHL